MSEIIERVLTMSVQAGALALFLLLVRRFTSKHVPPRLLHGLWLLPAARLLLPFSLQSPLSLMTLASNDAQIPASLPPMPLRTAAPYSPPTAPVSTPIATAPIASLPSPDIAPQPAAPVPFDLMGLLFYLWIGGMALTLFYTLAVNLRFSLKVRHARVRLDTAAKLPVYFVPGLASPCLYGYLRPVILVNGAAMQKEETLFLVLEHELCHYRAGDQWWALLRGLCCTAHWFNPVVWLCACRSRADCELACDARVMRGFTHAQRERYGMALLSILCPAIAPVSPVNATTAMAASRRELKARIGSIGRQPKTLRLAVTATVLFAVAAGLMACTEAGVPAQAPQRAVTISTPAPTDQNAQTSKPAFDFENASVVQLNNITGLSSVPDMVKETTLPGGTLLKSTCAREGDGEVSRLFINGVEALVCPWAFETLTGGEYDLTGDGTNELILFVRPAMSNFVSGDLHVYDLSAPGGVREILAFRGEPAFGGAPSLPTADKHPYLTLENGFAYTQNSDWNDYSKMLEGVYVMEFGGAYCLRLWHANYNSETAYTYLAWKNGWQVVGQEIVPTDQRALSPEEQNLLRRTLTADFDGDGMGDTALLEGYRENLDTVTPHATLTVALGNGSVLRHDFADEYWDADSLYKGDFDGDGKPEIAVFLRHSGSNYDAGIARVLKVENGALRELSHKIKPNDALPYGQYEKLLDGGIIGVSVIPGPHRDLLRVQDPVDVREHMTALYIDLEFNGRTWNTAAIAPGVAYGDELLPDTFALPDAALPHRPGFIEAELTANSAIFLTEDKRKYDSLTGTFAPTPRDMAQSALRMLYDMTGVQVKRCYYSGTWDWIYLSTGQKSRTTFLTIGYGRSVDADGREQRIYIMNFNYKGKNFPDSPIDPAAVVKPAGYESMTQAELALWYYENSSYGDRRAVVKTRENTTGNGEIALELATEEFYEVGFDEECGLPNSFYGPYPKGFTH